jgi:alkylation response protein AidB-like acyl-CoA dehydrogenase
MFTLNTEQLALQKTAREFATGEIAPVADHIDALPHDAVTPYDVIKPVFEKGVGLGFVSLLLPEGEGGLGLSALELCLIMEELGAADVAIAANYFSLTATMNLMISRAATPEQKARMLTDAPRLWSGALSEPNIAGSDLFCPSPDPRVGAQTSARREGDHYRINGHKSAFVTNAGIADAYIVMARSNFDAPPSQGMTMLYVPKDTPGLSFGRRTEMNGWKTAHHTEIYFDDVCIPVENRLGQEDQAGMIFATTPEVSVGLAACYVGLARAAYEYALDYARRRVSWGQPIIRHQAVALKLADMYVQTQSARLLVWDAAAACETAPMQAATLKAPTAKTAAVDAAIHNAQKAVEILGAYGVTREYKTAKYLNDAWIGYSCDFTRDLLRLGMVDFL